MIDEGYIKFQSVLTPGPPPSHPDLPDLIEVRNTLYRDGLIGIYADSGIGYGNVSLRAGPAFIISGTRTGGIAACGPEHFTLVTRSELNSNRVECTGPLEASSESMTHAMVYSSGPSIRCVLHVHHLGMWRWLHGKVPLSAPAVAYGTPGMAREVARLFRDADLARIQLMAMGGHEEGIIAFGEGPRSAASVLSHWYHRFKTAP